MKTYYSILNVPIRLSIGEQISIALILADEEKIHFRYSHSKIGIIKNLLPDSAFSFLKSYLKNLESEINKDLHVAPNESLNMPFDSKFKSYLGKNYLSYLSKYSNNLISFTEPKEINLEANSENFDKLFEKYVFGIDAPIQKPTKITFLERIKTNLYPKIEGKVNLDRRLTSIEIPELLFPTTINFIGRNEVPVTGQTIEFENNHVSIENHLAKYISLIKAFELGNEPNGKYFILGKEPEKSLIDNHKMWTEIKNHRLFDYVPMKEIGRVEEYMNIHGVQPFVIE